MSSKLAAVIVGMLFVAYPAAHADTLGHDTCKEAKARATGRKAFDLLEAFGKNEKRPIPMKLVWDVSKAESTFTRLFSRAEAREACVTSGDSGSIEAQVNAFVEDVMAEVSGITTTTATTTTTNPTAPGTTSTTVAPPCGVDSKCVFVSSRRWNGNLGGLDGADSKCNLAAANGPPWLLGREFRAWLSDHHVSASARLSHSTVPYRLVDGTLVANDWDDLVDGALTHPIVITELNTAPIGTYYVWTGTNPDGTTYNPFYPSSLCEDWTYGYWNALVGNASDQDERWTAYGRWLNEQMCDQQYHLYCFQQ